MDKMTGSEAVFGFCAWLTTRKKPTILSATDDAGEVCRLIDLFCKTNGLAEPRGNYTDYLKHPIESCEAACEETMDRQSKIIAAAEDLYDNRLGWGEGQDSYAPRRFWEQLGSALGRPPLESSEQPESA